MGRIQHTVRQNTNVPFEMQEFFVAALYEMSVIPTWVNKTWALKHTGLRQLYTKAAWLADFCHGLVAHESACSLLLMKE